MMPQLLFIIGSLVLMISLSIRDLISKEGKSKVSRLNLFITWYILLASILLLLIFILSLCLSK